MEHFVAGTTARTAADLAEVNRNMATNCRVYKCETPQDQAAVLEKAYQDMTK